MRAVARPGAFWPIHDYLFAHQEEITLENLKQKVATFAKGVKGLDFSEFQNCQENQMSLGLVLRDMNMASANNVAATPTLFINGHRIQGIKGAADLRELIADADAERTSQSGSPGADSH